MSNSNSGGEFSLSFSGLLALIFITLKLTHVIDWSWWWVLAPVWIPFALFIVFVIAVLLFVNIKWGK